MCYEAIGSAGGTYVALEPLSTTVQYSRRDVRASWLMALSLFGDVVRLPGAYGRPATAVDREFAALLFPLVESLLHNGCVKNHPVHVRKGDLGSLKRGIEELRVGLVRGEKLVYTLSAED
jgi:aspyridone synthetase trans-acting enoyl reductase